MVAERTPNSVSGSRDPLSVFVPLRANDQPDTDDARRVKLVNDLWASQDDLLRASNRQIEENIRMLAGQHWGMIHPLTGKWMDVTEWMSPAERRWKPRPVFNRLLPWFILTHARLTENPPIVTFVPGPDRIDAELAEIMDILFKTLWSELGMTQKVDLLMAWLIPSGRAYLQSRVDLNKGPLVPWIGRADELPIRTQIGEGEWADVVDLGTGEPLAGPPADDIPFGPDGQPLAHYDENGEIVETGEPHQEREGSLVVDVLSPLEVRGEWGPHPWEEKNWHMVRTYLSPEQVWEQFGVALNPDTTGGEHGELENVLFGTGFAQAHNGGLQSRGANPDTTGYVEITSLWQRPAPFPGMEEGANSAGGRYLCVASKQEVVLKDGPRPVAYPYCSPIRCFDFIRIPGRPRGTSPQDAMNPVQRAYNRTFAQLQEHVNLVTNPKPIIDKQSKINSETWTNQPGQGFVVNRRQGVAPVEYIQPPPLGQDVYKLLQLQLIELTTLGNLQGTQGEMPAPDASGELVKELRFNSDRFLGPTVRRAVEEFGRMIEDWRVLLPMIWPDEKVLAYAGEDNVARTLLVRPIMFEKGRVNIRPDAESMLPEGRGERQQRVWQMYMNGMFGIPGSPQALKQFFELARFPHLSRTAKPGGEDRITAEHENAMLLQGTPGDQIPVFEWYDDEIHLMVHESLMKTPEFLAQPDEIKAGFIQHRQVHLINLQKKAADQMQQMAAMQGAPAGAGPGGSSPGGAGPSTMAAAAGAPPFVDSAANHAPASVPGGGYPNAIQ